MNSRFTNFRYLRQQLKIWLLNTRSVNKVIKLNFYMLWTKNVLNTNCKIEYYIENIRTDLEYTFVTLGVVNLFFFQVQSTYIWARIIINIFINLMKLIFFLRIIVLQLFLFLATYYFLCMCILYWHLTSTAVWTRIFWNFVIWFSFLQHVYDIKKF